LVRSTHWYNAVLIVTLLFLGQLLLLTEQWHLVDSTKDAILGLHVALGYALAAGILLRVIWLFVGPSEASWRDCLPLTREQQEVALGTWRYYFTPGPSGESPFYRAHNPLAGLAYLSLWIIMIGQIVTGVILEKHNWGDIKDPTPFLSAVYEIHEWGYYLTIGYILLHVPMVVFHEFKEKRGLASSMIHGFKFFTRKEIEEHKIPDSID